MRHLGRTTLALVDVHLNDLTLGEYGVDNLGAGTVDATGNWWGCTAGPGTTGCSMAGGTNVMYMPVLMEPYQAN